MAGRRRYRSTSMRRRKIWSYDSLGQAATLAQGAQALTELATGINIDVRAGSTLIRQIGQVAIRAGGLGADVRAMFALQLMNEDAFNAAAIPELEVDDADYIWMTQLVQQRGSIDAEQWLTVRFDNHGMRKYETAEQRYVMQVENISDGANNVDVLWSVRTLLLLA